jgi:hypothetical protein|tara:strand:- start:1288 stop:1578 length:291 start_codon:yes stop_codon:yes gene_type:complete
MVKRPVQLATALRIEGVIMSKPIHKVQVGDLVRNVKMSVDHPGPEVFMVVDVSEPIGYEWYRGNPLYTHEISLKLWEVTEPIDHTHWAPSNYYQVV